ncbi:MAG: DUF721 domain-containing protein [Planctomycetes bacterium]|nr:DUF721 domain-containing protein [Planctomycetota bacterium]
MKPKFSNVKHIKNILRDVLPKYNLAGRMSLDAVSAAWREAVGEPAAGMTGVSSLRKGVLQVIVNSPSVKHDLENFRCCEILEQLKKKLPEKNIKKLKFVIK